MRPDAPSSDPLPASRKTEQDVAWWMWLLGQTTIVALYAGRVRLAGGYPQPVESTADLGVACGQLVLAILLSPLLWTSRGQVIRTASVAGLMTVIAAELAGRSVIETFGLSLIVASWLAAFAACSRYRPASLLLLFLTIAGPILFYASVEYSPQPIVFSSWPTLLSPVLGVCTTRLHDGPWRAMFAPVAILFAARISQFFRKPAAAAQTAQPT